MSEPRGLGLWQRSTLPLGVSPGPWSHLYRRPVTSLAWAASLRRTWLHFRVRRRSQPGRPYRKDSVGSPVLACWPHPALHSFLSVLLTTVALSTVASHLPPFSRTLIGHWEARDLMQRYSRHSLHLTPKSQCSKLFPGLT